MKYYFNINFYCKFIFLVLFLLFIIKGNATNINEAIKQTYSDSPHLKSLRAKLKASDEKIGRVLSKYRPNINLTSSVGADKTKTINISYTSNKIIFYCF